MTGEWSFGAPPGVRRHFRLRQDGWTLIELLIVISLVSVLAGIGLANYRHAVTRSQEAVLKENLFRMRDAIDQYHADKGRYPSTLQSLASEGYLRRIPEDPFTRSAATWQEIPADIDLSNPSAEPGIFDVRSGADALSMDGTRYSEW